MLQLNRKFLSLLLAALLLLTACGKEEAIPAEPGEGPFTLTAALALPETLDPAKSGGTIACHLFENLMTWADDGGGYARLVPGQAESYTLEVDYAGCATCTFTLREDIRWSDGEPVEAEDFVLAWQRLADPANDLPDRYLMSVVAGYQQVQESGDASLLAVSAPDARTFVVTLQSSFAGFLEELCAGCATMPVRQDLADSGKWGKPEAGMVSNGPYTLAEAGSEGFRLERNLTYHSVNLWGPEELRFVPSAGSEGDYAKLRSGELDFMLELPESALLERVDGPWLPEPENVTYAVLFNTQRAPFDVPEVRQALCLAVNTPEVTRMAGDLTLRTAQGLVPYGVADFGQRAGEEPQEPEEEVPVLPGGIPAAEPEEEPAQRWDFRAHASELVTLSSGSDYAAGCAQARSLLLQAGYGPENPFPEVEYLYVDIPGAQAAAQALSDMWRQQLGITVTPRAVSQEEYDALTALTPLPESALDGEEPVPQQVGDLPLATGDFFLAAQEFTASRDDAGAFLTHWRSGQSPTGYASGAFDILLSSASAAMAPEAQDARDAYLHDAEAILLSDGAVLPLFCRGRSFALAENLTGMYRTADGAYFFTAVEKIPAEAP